MGFREYLQKLEKKGALQKIKNPASKKLEASGILKAAEPKPVLFEKIKESGFQVAGNIFPTKDSIADYLGCKTSEL
ncbi:MAG: UbiD family decarboxylase, partial [Candidatus Diapherotrites archaeon]|nr:UbiD family decarboxylase [Candidatus Diapherotrites archaeon]